MADAGPYAEINAAVRAALPADAVLTGDSSQVTYFGSVHFFDLPAPRRFCYSPGYATLGYGLPAGLGAAIGRPGAAVAVLLGDGALMFSVQELITLVEQRLPVPVIVVDNGGYQEIKDQEAVARHPTDRGRTADPGSGRPRGRHGRARGAYHLDGRTNRTGRWRPWRRRTRPSSISISAERT